MERVVILHEILNTLYQEKHSGFLYKVDFKKTYNKVDLVFIHRMLKVKGFHEEVCNACFEGRLLG